MTWDTAAGMMFFLPKWKVGLGWGLQKTWESRAASQVRFKKKSHSERQLSVMERV